MKQRTLLGLGLLLALAARGDLRPLTVEDIGRSQRVPSVGRPVTYTVRLQAAADQAVTGPVTVTLAVNGSAVAQTQALLPAGAPVEAPLPWTPAADGWYTLRFQAQATTGKAVSAELRVPVTARPVYFVWFGAPQRFSWCNVPTTVDSRQPAEVAWWQWHGGIPCAWKGGVCYKEWTTGQFSASYNASPWIAIDEVGGLDETGQKIMTAVRAHKQTHPNGFRLIWYMGVQPDWKDYADCVDLFVPEIYLNYRGNHLGHIDDYVRLARATGVMERMIPGLGINIILDEAKQPKTTPTRDDVLRQIRHLKEVAPELPGVGFFTSDSAAPGVAEYADELCETYYLNPVLTLVPGSLTATARGHKLDLSVVVRNAGGMAAREVRLEGWPAYDQDQASRRGAAVTLAHLAASEDRRVTVTLGLEKGIGVYSVRLATPDTVLQGHLWTAFGRAVPAPVAALCQPPTRTAGPALPRFGGAPRGATWNRVYLAGEPAPSGTAAVLPGLPGAEQDTVTWVNAADTASAPMPFRFDTAAAEAGAAGAPALEGTLLRGRIGTASYGLDVGRDELVSLKATPTGTELLGSPWRFDCTAWEGRQPPQLRPLAAGLEVTVPFANPLAEGYSRYFLYREAPVIRVERYLKPRGELQVTAASEGCHFPQRGGTFALQAGAGGVVTRGELQDGTDYRDLLFGYGGAAPGPENAALAGWFDFAFDQAGGGGLGVAIERRWTAAHSEVGYDVTRYYDAGDWLQVLNLWGKTAVTVREPQTQVVYLIAHAPLDLRSPTVIAPAQSLWGTLRTPAFPVPSVP
jgi:hypothetical protein